MSVDLESAPPLKEVALPTEHGGWSLTLEPAILGLLVAPSLAGVCLAASALLAFVARTPLKLALVDRWRDRRLPRTIMAERVATVEIVVLVALFAVAVAAAAGPFWWPLVPAAPLVVIELWYDMRSRSRRLVPELLGSIGIGSVAAIIVLADGGDDLLAAGLWWVIAARSVAAIPFVRLQLRRGKGQSHRLAASDLAQLLAVVAVVIGWAVDAVPLAGAVAVAVLAAVHLVLARRPVPKVAIIGAQQVVLGLSVVLATGLGALSP